MPGLPTGTVTFLFTDIEGSTKRWEQYPQHMQLALSQHDMLLRSAIEKHGGYTFKTMGDAFYAAFHTPLSALSAALQAQHALHQEEWPQEIGFVSVRMALHTGMVEHRDDDYFGQPLNRVARLLSAGHGGQVLLSQPTYDLVRDSLPTHVTLLNLGEHRLKDLIRPEHIFQLVTPGLPEAFPPLKTLDSQPNNLPLQLTPFIGREKEIEEVLTLLSMPEVRLLTLTGPGGTGKTRLALQVAADLLEHFTDGVWFVDLAPITDTNLVVSTIAHVLGVKEVAGQPLIDTIKAYLQEKSLLLVLDNFEQVADSGLYVGQLLTSCPHLKVLVTSREPLKIRGEKEHAVPSLSLPGAEYSQSIDRLSQYEAVRLFIERARDVKSDFQITNENAPAVAEICVRLDGLPLAIELAAARVKVLPPQAILARLQNRLKLLIGGSRDVPARQQTLRGAIEWSYYLLSDDEKKLFRRMSVFVGGRTLEAIEAVCNQTGDLELDVLDGVSSLVDKSLLRQVEGVGGEPRFVMLETIHEFAREKLEVSGEEEALKRQHALYFMKLAEEAEPHLTGPKQQEWLSTLEDEYDNIRAALRWVSQNEEYENAEIGLRIVGSIWRFWYVRGYYTEGREQLRGLLSPAATLGFFGSPGSTSRSNRTISKALNGEGALALRQGDYVAVRTALEQVVSIGSKVGDKPNIALALTNLGAAAAEQDDYAAARSLYEEGLLLQRELGNQRGIAVSLSNLANVVTTQGDYQRACTLYEESLALARQAGSKQVISTVLSNLGSLAVNQGDYQRGRVLQDESLLLSRELQDKQSIANSLANLGSIAQHEADYALASSLYEESLTIQLALGNQRGVALSVARLGNVAFMQKDYARARLLYRQSLAIFEELGNRVSSVWCMAELGAVAAVTGHAEQGATLMGAADTQYELIGAAMYPEDRIPYDIGVASARAKLGEEGFEKAHQEGRAMSMEEAIEYALQES